MNWTKTAGLGVLFWLIMFALASGFVAFDWLETSWGSIVLAVLGGVVAWWLAGFLKPNSAATALTIGFSFAVIGLLLDWLITSRFDPEVFQSWELWFSYILVVLVPLLQVKKAAMTY